jgi:hypothetical protein
VSSKTTLIQTLQIRTGVLKNNSDSETTNNDNTDSDTISYEMHSYYYRRQKETTHLYMTLLPNIVKPVFTVFSKLNGDGVKTNSDSDIRQGQMSSKQL